NGAGKTTLIRQLSGEMRPTAGSVVLDGRDITAAPMHRRSHMGLARSYQITSIFPDMTARENVALAVQAHDGHSFRFWARAADDAGLTGPAQA
ncbi:ATP-binding cassette domain-containing protein, partial [Escherichia coli]|uniref:ATP-binding cassette domain-containing protein n=1 Tax=Escherichia coli TaxID=562 RepID=UPI00278BFB0F